VGDACFIDSNVLLRFLLSDHPEHSSAARDLIQRIAEGKIQAWTTELVISELVYVLTGPLLRRERTEVAEVLRELVALPGLALDKREVVQAAMEIWVTKNVDWIDAYHAALARARGESRLYSFDRDFDRLAGITRFEPGLQ